MLLVHTEFLARINAGAARSLLSEFKKMTELLENNPHTFSFADEQDVPNIPFETYRKCVFGKRYKALYLIEDSDVHVDVIIDCRQENANLY
jgi:plasmid stabilization system protein ParE